MNYCLSKFAGHSRIRILPVLCASSWLLGVSIGELLYVIDPENTVEDTFRTNELIASFSFAKAIYVDARWKIPKSAEVKIPSMEVRSRGARPPGPGSAKIATWTQSDGGDCPVVKLRLIVMIHDLRRQGLSISAISRKTGLNRKTVRKYLDAGLVAGRSRLMNQLLNSASNPAHGHHARLARGGIPEKLIYVHYW